MKRSALQRKTPLAAARSSIQRKQRVTTEQDAARKRTVKRATAKSKKPKIPKTTYVQSIFNTLVKERGNWICVRCKQDFSNDKGKLHASHFWGVRHTSVRFDFENLDPLCYVCHYGNKRLGWEFNKQGEYRDYMIQKLGEEGYEALRQKAIEHKQLIEAKREFMEWYKANKDTAIRDSRIANESPAGGSELEEAA